MNRHACASEAWENESHVRGLLIFAFPNFRGAKILANRSKAGEQNFPRTHTREPARRLYTDNFFGLGLRSVEFQQQRNIERK